MSASTANTVHHPAPESCDEHRCRSHRRVQSLPASQVSVQPAVDAACARIAPTWPLDRFIAVNPYWGQLERPIAAGRRATGGAVGQHDADAARVVRRAVARRAHRCRASAGGHRRRRRPHDGGRTGGQPGRSRRPCRAGCRWPATWSTPSVTSATRWPGATTSPTMSASAARPTSTRVRPPGGRTAAAVCTRAGCASRRTTSARPC